MVCIKCRRLNAVHEDDDDLSVLLTLNSRGDLEEISGENVSTYMCIYIYIQKTTTSDKDVICFRRLARGSGEDSFTLPLESCMSFECFVPNVTAARLTGHMNIFTLISNRLITDRQAI